MKVLVSACLLGENCKYSGGNNLCPRLLDWLAREGHEAVPVCPEQLGGLPTPRMPAEIADGVVMTRDGKSVDREIAGREEIGLAVLQPRSPSCGAKQVYDGTFTGRKVPGTGIFAGLLAENGIRTLEPEDLP